MALRVSFVGPTGFPNNALEGSNYGLLQINGYLVDKPSGGHTSPRVNFQDCQGRVDRPTCRDGRIRKGATYLELNAANAESVTASHLNEPEHRRNHREILEDH